MSPGIYLGLVSGLLQYKGSIYFRLGFNKGFPSSQVMYRRQELERCRKEPISALRSKSKTFKERMSNRSRIVCQSLASQLAPNLEISRRFSTHLKIERPSQGDVGRLLALTNGLVGVAPKSPSMNSKDVRRNLDATTQNHSRKNKNKKTVSIPPKKSKKGLRDGSSWEPDRYKADNCWVRTHGKH